MGMENLAPTGNLSPKCPACSKSLSRPTDGKAIPVQAWADPEDSRRLRLPGIMTAHDKVVTPTHWLPSPPPQKYSWYSYLLEAELTPGP